MPLRLSFIASALPPSSAPTSVRSWAAAVSYSLRTDCTTLSISTCSLAEADSIDDLTLTISGWRSPYFSDSSACCRCRSPRSPFSFWMYSLPSTAGNASIALLLWIERSWL